MVVGMGILTFRLHDCRSLKAKRSVVKSIVHQIRNHFNASVAEVGANDIHQRAQIGFALAGSDHQMINVKIDKLINFVDDLGLAEMIDSEMEILHL
jgi:uncharacterized protein YlxP (DUF503 family)